MTDAYFIVKMSNFYNIFDKFANLLLPFYFRSVLLVKGGADEGKS